MKTIPIALAAHYAQPTTSLAYFLKVVRADSAVFGTTSASRPVTIDGVVYNPGFDPSTIVSSSGLAVDNLELTVLKDDDLELSDVDLLAGLWNNAAFTIFEANYLSPGDGINIIKRGSTGDATIKQGSWTIEFRSLKQALQQSVGAVTEKNCRARLGDNLCRFNLFYVTYAGVAETVTTRQVWVDSSQTQPDGYFDNGSVKFTTGANAGYERRVKTFILGIFTLAIAMPFEILPGDEYTAIAGCLKRRTEDCKEKFNNVLNFQGEPDLPGVDALTALPDVGDAG